MAQLAKYGFLNQKKTLFLLCDIQDKFRPGMKNFDAMVKNAQKLVQAGKILDIPLIASEHYPQKLGNLVKELDVTHAKRVFPKTLFSMVVPELRKEIKEMPNLETVVIFGLETHICLEQSAMDIRDMGIDVHVVADCCSSRSEEDRLLALKRLQQIGCFVTTSESVIFKLMRDKNHPKFDEVRKLVTGTSVDTGLAKL